MLSLEYIFFFNMWRPVLVRKALRMAFQLSEKMLNYYCSILECPLCCTNLAGFWRVRVTELFDGAIAWIRNYGSREDFRQLLAMPMEQDEMLWRPYFQQMFSIYRQRSCHALEVMISERLVDRREIPRVVATESVEPTTADEEEDLFCHAFNVFRGVGRYVWNVNNRPSADWTWTLQRNVGSKYI